MQPGQHQSTLTGTSSLLLSPSTASSSSSTVEATPSTAPAPPPPARDIFRDSLLRYAGYCNEIGESFRSMIPRWAYLGSYAVSSLYVAGDATDKGAKAYTRTMHHTDPAVRAREIGVAVVDTALWQAAASVIIPGLVINRTVYATGRVVEGLGGQSGAKGIVGVVGRLFNRAGTRRWAGTVAGLCAIPLIIKPIDHAVDVAMDVSYRRLVRGGEGRDTKEQ